MFEEKEKVVCINDSFTSHLRQYYNDFPVKNEIYTIRELTPGRSLDGRTTMMVTLDEIINPVQGNNNYERGYEASRFAPLIPPDLDEIDIEEDLPDEAEKEWNPNYEPARRDKEFVEK